MLFYLCPTLEINVLKQLAASLAIVCAANVNAIAGTTDATATNNAPCISWTSPLVKPHFAILCVHGLGLYSRSYADFGMRMSRHGAAVYAIDVRGFGSWMKSAGHDNIDFNACLNDIKQALVSIKQAHPDLPVFLLGESMGGAIALRAASIYPELINGLISSVPAGDRFQQKRTDLKVAFEVLTGPNRDHTSIGKKVVEQASTSDMMPNGKKQKDVNKELVEAWEGDPLDRMDLSAKDLIQFQRFMNDNHESAKKIASIPVLMVQGIDDRLVRPDGTWELFKDLGTYNRTMVSLPARHLIFEEGQTQHQQLKEETMHLVIGWIMAQTGNRAPAAVAAGATGELSTSPLTLAIDKLVAAKYGEALTDLQAIITQDPGNAEAHYWLGVAYMKQKRPLLARIEFATAMRLSKGIGHSREANEQLLDLAKEDPQSGTESGAAAASALNKVDTAVLAKLANGKPAILTFYADWCDQCTKLDKMLTQIQQMCGDKVSCQKIDVSEPANEAVIKAFNVGPIPTIVFVKPDGTVTSTLIGQSSFVNVAKSIGGLMRP